MNPSTEAYLEELKMKKIDSMRDLIAAKINARPGEVIEVSDKLIKQLSSLDTQVAGSHYQMPIQPVEFIHKNGLGFIVGNVVKYVVRYKQKNGIEDLKKARHYLDMLIEMESNQPAP